MLFFMQDIIEAFSDAIAWIMSNYHGAKKIVKVITDTREEATFILEIFYELCHNLGIPIATNKTKGPTTCLTFLRIELNTIEMTAKLPRDKIY